MPTPSFDFVMASNREALSFNQEIYLFKTFTEFSMYAPFNPPKNIDNGEYLTFETDGKLTFKKGASWMGPPYFVWGNPSDWDERTLVGNACFRAINLLTKTHYLDNTYHTKGIAWFGQILTDNKVTWGKQMAEALQTVSKTNAEGWGTEIIRHCPVF